MKKTAILGGTFNPLHLAHIRLIETVCAAKIVDDILLIPNRIPPHKECDYLAEDEHRLNMCKIVADKYSNVRVCDIELKREGKSYTYDTVMTLKKIRPAQYFFICGADMINTFHTWYRADELIKEMNIIAIRRGGIDDLEFNSSVQNLKNIGANLIVLDMPPLEISSTMIRNGGDETNKLLSQEIAQYIKDNKLYGR